MSIRSVMKRIMFEVGYNTKKRTTSFLLSFYISVLILALYLRSQSGPGDSDDYDDLFVSSEPSSTLAHVIKV